jgi:PAB-dependent poly(A)-specific ribonuclease subunit 3
MDQGHVVTALNKLDAADEEKIVLTSRDGKTMLVVSFADVARSLESAYSELCSGSVLPSSLQY